MIIVVGLSSSVKNAAGRVPVVSYEELFEVNPVRLLRRFDGVYLYVEVK